MPETTDRAHVRQRLIQAAQQDPRIVGLLDYGSSSEGRLDEWSDLDIALFLRDRDYEAFLSDWKPWAAQFGDLLLAYVGYVGHPWAVYAAEPAPLRVDFDAIRESAIEQVPAWPNSPTSVTAMLLYDGTAGRLAAAVQQLVGKSLRPGELQAEFERDCGDLWYFLLFCYAKLQRGEIWSARQVFHTVVLEALLRLLRLTSGATDRWESSQAAWGIEQALDAADLTRLDACIAGPTPDDLRGALHAAALLGRDTCAVLAGRHDWSWPQRLAKRVVQLLQADGATGHNTQHSDVG